MSAIDRTWIQKRSTIAVDFKRKLARYAATHLISHGDVVFIGSGTSLSALMFEIVSRQASGEALDLQVVTSNLQIIGMGRGSVLNGRAAREKDQDEARFLQAFKATQIVLTGGEVNPSLDSLIGDNAVRGIRDPLFHPTTVFFGARGLSFEGGLTITYQFLDELSAQEAYATRPTRRRVVLCDHTKLGVTEGRQTPMKIESLLEHADECIFLSTLPEPVAAVKTVADEISAFNRLCVALADQDQFEGKELALWMINGADERRVAGSLASTRLERKGGKLRSSGARLVPTSRLDPLIASVAATESSQK